MTIRFVFPLLVLFSVWLPQTHAANVVKAYDKAARMNNASLYTELPFEPGSADLTQDMRTQLHDLLQRAQAKGQIEEVKVISWADKEYPKGRRRSLDRESRRIADERGIEVENYFTDNAKGTKVTRYNMAEKPDAIEQLLKTSPNVQVKNSLAATGLLHPEQSGLPPKASRSLVMVVIK